MEGSDGGFLDRLYRPIGFSIGPGTVGLGPSMFDAICRADRTNDMIDKTIFSPFVVLDVLNAVIR